MNNPQKNLSNKSQRYRKFIELIALNDESGSKNAFDIQAVSEYTTVGLVAACYDLNPDQVAKDVIHLRIEKNHE